MSSKHTGQHVLGISMYTCHVRCVYQAHLCGSEERHQQAHPARIRIFSRLTASTNAIPQPSLSHSPNNSIADSLSGWAANKGQMYVTDQQLS